MRAVALIGLAVAISLLSHTAGLLVAMGLAGWIRATWSRR